MLLSSSFCEYYTEINVKKVPGTYNLVLEAVVLLGLLVDDQLLVFGLLLCLTIQLLQLLDLRLLYLQVGLVAIPLLKELRVSSRVVEVSVTILLFSK